MSLDRKRTEAFLAIAKKANKVLQVLSLLLFFIVIRLFFLTVYEHKNKKQLERTLTQKVVYESPRRGTIHDRFGICLAKNIAEYQACIVWADIIEKVPRWASSVDSGRIPLRKKYIQAFCSMLAKELSLDAQRIEDIIYSYAVFSHTVPVPIKTGLSEAQFYRLNAKVRLWPGLVVERKSRRIYPKKHSACHLVGYMAPLSRTEYDSIICEIHTLRTYLKAKEVGEDVELPSGITSYCHATERLAELERCGYGIFDSIGKVGIEASFDEQLRGMRGVKKYITNARGDRIALSSSSKRSQSGKRIILTISSELQEYCEKLLLKSEEDRERWQQGKRDKAGHEPRSPHFRGGAIVVLDPTTSQVLAMASTPRFDPNEAYARGVSTFLFQKSQSQVLSWQRNSLLAAALWDRRAPMIKEYVTEQGPHGVIAEKSEFLSWDLFLQLICPHSTLMKEICSEQSVQAVLSIQEDLFALSSSLDIDARTLIEQIWKGKVCVQVGENAKRVARLQKIVMQASSVQEAMLFFDIGRLVLRKEFVSSSLACEIGSYTMKEMRSFACAKAYFLSLFEEKAFAEFQKGPFMIWRKIYEKRFLKEKRAEEESLKKPAQPFLVYLDSECRAQFSIWWDKAQLLLLRACAGSMQYKQLSKPLKRCLQQGLLSFFLQDEVVKKECREFFSAIRVLAKKNVEEAFVQCVQTYRDLEFNLIGSYRVGGAFEPIVSGKGLVHSLFSLSPPPTLSFAYAQVSPPGSIFKLVTAYTAMQAQVKKNKTIPLLPSFFLFEDRVWRQGSKIFVGVDGQGCPIPQVYRGGRIPKSLHSHIGKVDLIGAIAASSNPYFALLADEKIDQPNDLVESARLLGFGEKTEVCLPFEASGRVPCDLSSDKTGLYTTAIGQHTLLATPLQEAMMLSALSTDGTVAVPQLLKMALGRDGRSGSSFHGIKKEYRRMYRQLGCDMPLFLQHRSLELPYRMIIPKAKVKRKVTLEPQVQKLLLAGMGAVVRRLKKEGEMSCFGLQKQGSLMKTFLSTSGMVGKSSTAESLETIGLMMGAPPFMYSHTCFGAIFFDEGVPLSRKEKTPSLVVVVFLRYGAYGRHAAPLAAAVHAEWKRIWSHHGVKGNCVQ